MGNPALGPAPIDGFTEPGFESVRAVFETNFTDHGDIGAAVCVYHRGRPVVDLWGGWADLEAAQRWRRDTLQPVFSSTKGVTATCVHLLVQRGVLDLDAPVARYWPEFAAHGKATIPLRWVLSHQAGLPIIPAEIDLADVLAWHPVVEAIAASEPLWEPGTASGYHARTFGWILGEIVRRVTGMTVGTFLAKAIAEPLGLDLFIGLPDAQMPRVAKLYPPVVAPEVQRLMDAFMGPETLLGQVLSRPSELVGYREIWATPAVLAGEIPSSNGVSTARALARLYASTIGEVDGTRLLNRATIARAATCVTSGTDKVIGLEMPFGLGYMTPLPFGPARCFGHVGAGGSLGIADADGEWSLGYVMNQMELGLTGDARGAGLVEAAASSVDALG